MSGNGRFRVFFRSFPTISPDHSRSSPLFRIFCLSGAWLKPSRPCHPIQRITRRAPDDRLWSADSRFPTVTVYSQL